MSDDPQTRERMQHALKTIQDYKGPTKEYLSYVKSAPAMIRQIGLGQTLAVIKSRSQGKSAGNQAYKALYSHLQTWLCRTPNQQDGRSLPAPFSAGKDLLANVTGANQVSYLHAQTETELYLGWLKKFAVAFLSDEEPSQQEGEE